MEHSEKVNMILEHCNTIQCDMGDECPIQDICDAIQGKFSEHIDATEVAIMRLTATNENEAEDEQDETEQNDVVNHPSHYCHGGMECIDEMILLFGKEAVKHFCVCNAWKYRKRAMHKNGEEDMKKSDWYIAKYKELSEDAVYVQFPENI